MPLSWPSIVEEPSFEIFGDPLQRLYGDRSERGTQNDRIRWEGIRRDAACETLDYPHRWKDGSPALGAWILKARTSLEAGQPIDLTKDRPNSVRVLIGDNLAQQRGVYRLSREDRLRIERVVDNADKLMILASQNDFVTALSAFWGRSIPVWEGHTREALAALVTVLREKSGDAESIAAGVVEFIGSIGAGFSKSSHGNRLIREVREGCARTARGKPAHIQSIARHIIENPNHVGVAAAVTEVRALIDARSGGFDSIKIDHRSELRDATRLGQFAGPDEAFAEIARKRSYGKPSPPAKALSTIHKAKGLECDNVLLMACDKSHFSATNYARRKMYVALSRATKTLTLVIPTGNHTDLFKIT